MCTLTHFARPLAPYSSNPSTLYAAGFQHQNLTLKRLPHRVFRLFWPVMRSSTSKKFPLAVSEDSAAITTKHVLSPASSNCIAERFAQSLLIDVSSCRRLNSAVGRQLLPYCRTNETRSQVGRRSTQQDISRGRLLRDGI